MAASSSSYPYQHCANCGTSLTPGALLCPNCRRFVYAEELEEAAVRARQLLAVGHVEAARDQWLAMLPMLPPESNQYQSIMGEVRKLNYRLNPRPENAPKKTDWRKRFGPLGIVIAAFLKFKTLGLLFLTKGKFLLLGLTHFKMIFSILAFLGGVLGAVWLVVCHWHHGFDLPVMRWVIIWWPGASASRRSCRCLFPGWALT